MKKLFCSLNSLNAPYSKKSFANKIEKLLWKIKKCLQILQVYLLIIGWKKWILSCVTNRKKFIKLKTWKNIWYRWIK